MTPKQARNANGEALNALAGMGERLKRKAAIAVRICELLASPSPNRPKDSNE